MAQGPFSPRTQVLQNYFDGSDVRMRTFSHTIDAQLLNIAATKLDDLDLRYAREVKARFMQTCPLHIDNQGVYYGAKLPNTFVLPAEGSNPPLSSVIGTRGGQTVTLAPYDDRLPVPARITVDATRPTVRVDTVTLVDWTSKGQPQYSVSPALTLPVPSSLTFWMEGAEVPGNLDILVTGVAYPCSAWQRNRTTTTETVTYRLKEGLIETTTVWYSVQSIVLRNAPAGVRIVGVHLPFGLVVNADPDRPYTRPAFRDVLWDRYWQMDGPWLVEQCHGGPSVELLTVNRYQIPEPLLDLNVEPHANTLLGVSNSKLYVFDRRAQLPEHLDVTGITADPLYSLNVVPDETRSSTSVRYAALQPLAHENAGSLLTFRYVVEDPQGNPFCVSPAGTFLTYSGAAGWTHDTPAAVSIPLNSSGTYVITLECMDTTGVVSEYRCPYLNPALTPLAVLDLSLLVPQAIGIARDSLERLWIWTGTFAVPVQLHYDSYVLDYDGRAVYLTDPFDQVSVSA